MSAVNWDSMFGLGRSSEEAKRKGHSDSDVRKHRYKHSQRGSATFRSMPLPFARRSSLRLLFAFFSVPSAIASDVGDFLGSAR